MSCAVVCEKPFTPTSQEADELNAIAKKNNKLLAVYQSKLPGTPVYVSYNGIIVH